jgi:hypothetical protein
MSLVGRMAVPHPLRRMVAFRAMAVDVRCIHQLTRNHHSPIQWIYYYGAQHRQRRRHFSEFPGGVDLLEEGANEERPKITLDAYAPTGFDVSNMIQKVNKGDEETSESGAVHMTGSIFAFPRACFLWNITSAENITLETLAPVIIYRPKIKYLFLGCNAPIPSQELNRIKTELKKRAGIVAEQLTLVQFFFFVFVVVIASLSQLLTSFS